MEDDEIRLRENEPKYNCPTCGDTGRYRPFDRTFSGIECIQVTETMNFCLGNAIKYIWRSSLKGATVEDLRKAIWYLEREIKRIS